MRRLQVTYKIQTTPEDGLNEVLVEFVPWQNSIFNIVRISYTGWDDYAMNQITTHYCLKQFTNEQQSKLKKILLDEYSLYVGYESADG